MPVDDSVVLGEVRPTIRPIDLASIQSIHIVGIGGAGMRAIARILLAMGHSVSGSDRAASTHADQLVALGATVHIGHDSSHGVNADIVCRSTAVPDDNPDVVGARSRGVQVYSRADILSAIVAQRPAILIAGTHGKTTTSSMLAVLLDHAERDPSFIIGSDVAYFGTGARWAASDDFVVEADESDGTFLTLQGAHAIVTSLDPDHLEYYGSAERLRAAFGGFVDNIAGTTAVCIDDADTSYLVGRDGVEGGWRWSGADAVRDGLLETMRRCLSGDPAARPSVGDAAASLAELTATAAPPPTGYTPGVDYG